MNEKLFLSISTILSLIISIPVFCLIYKVNVFIGDDFAAGLLVTALFGVLYGMPQYFSLFYTNIVDKRAKKEILIAKQMYASKSESEINDIIWENSRGFNMLPPSGTPCYDQRTDEKELIIYYCRLELKRRAFIKVSKWMIAYVIIAAFSLGLTI